MSLPVGSCSDCGAGDGVSCLPGCACDLCRLKAVPNWFPKANKFTDFDPRDEHGSPIDHDVEEL